MHKEEFDRCRAADWIGCRSMHDMSEFGAVVKHQNSYLTDFSTPSGLLLYY
jgi:hypothetical protein